MLEQHGLLQFQTPPWRVAGRKSRYDGGDAYGREDCGTEQTDLHRKDGTGFRETFQGRVDAALGRYRNERRVLETLNQVGPPDHLRSIPFERTVCAGILECLLQSQEM